MRKVTFCKITDSIKNVDNCRFSSYFVYIAVALLLGDKKYYRVFLCNYNAASVVAAAQEKEATQLYDTSTSERAIFTSPFASKNEFQNERDNTTLPSTRSKIILRIYIHNVYLATCQKEI